MGGADRAANCAADDEGHDDKPDDAPFAVVPGLHLLNHDSSSIRGLRELVNGNSGPKIFGRSAVVVRDRRRTRAMW
jgi:hypothetical protein